MAEILEMPAATLYPIVWRMVERKEIESAADYLRAAERGGRPEYRYFIEEEDDG